MCGIAGYVGVHRPEILEPMCDAMAHRGPDDAGTWFDESARVGLGHRRLSIIDLSPAGHQPMSGPDERTWIAYNGEIYNFPEHRERLAAGGYPFRSRTDTEVLLALYEDKGDDLVHDLNGIFSFALWDGRRRRLLLARDHAGIKPLYYRQEGDALYFASEIKSLLRIPGLERRVHGPSVADYLTYLWVPGEHTMLDGIEKLEPGHRLVWEDGRVRVEPWFELAYEPDETVSEAEWVERVHDSFMETARRQMLSDVPLGAFLSGGLDSSSIVACMRHSFPEREINTYTIQFADGDMAEEQGVDDYPYARRAAEATGVKLNTVRLSSDVIRLMPKMIYHLDEPDADTAVMLSYLICKQAREDGIKVLLSGTGGDEIFFGYRSHLAYRQYERFAALGRSPLRQLVTGTAALGGALFGSRSLGVRRLAKFARGLGLSGLERHVALAQWSSREAREGLLRPELREVSTLDGMTECMLRYRDAFVGRGENNLHSHLLIQTFLAAHNFNYTDKSSMATSVEVRVPFMDVELMRLCARIPESLQLSGGVTKALLKKSMERHLPKDLIYRSKTGFGSPLRKWLAEDLKEWVRDALAPEQIRRRGLFDPAYVARVLDENDSDRADHAYLIYALLCLETWMRTFIDEPGVEVSL
ncbi:MAG: asparagine synthase (glutamine-hydrolyzing) [Myxococcota bacterium]